MTRLKYTLIDTQANWEENLYHDVVQVIGGFVETDNPLTIDALQYRGFEIVGEEDVAEPSVPPAPVPPVARGRGRRAAHAAA